MNRRYFCSSIDELETLFENRKDDGSLLKALQDELAHRKTERAVKLRHCVAMRLTQLGVCSSKSTLQEHSVQFERVPNINPFQSLTRPSFNVDGILDGHLYFSIP